MTGKFFIRSLLIVSVMFIAGIIFIVLLNKNLSEQEVLTVNKAGFSLASKIEDRVNRPLSAAYALAAIIKTYGGFSSQQEFESIAQKITELYDGVSFLAAAPNAVTSFIYPLHGNEKAIGHDLLNDPKRRDDVLRTIQSRSLTLSGPYELVQGGVSILGRLAVFRDTDETESNFWGLAVVSIDLSKLLYDLELDSILDSGFLYEITRKDSPSDQEKIILTSIGEEYDKKKYAFSLNLLNSFWYLYIVPKKNRAYDILAWEVLILFIVLLVAFTIAYKLLKQTYDIKTANMELHMQIKEKEKIELELIAAKKNADTANNAKSLFLANMSHEIKTPLNGIMGFISLLNKTALDKEQKELVKQAEISGRSLKSLISDILDISKIEADKIELNTEPSDIRNLIDEVVTIFLPLVKEKNIRLSVDISKDTPKVLDLDTGRLKQILINLIGNAVKFTEQGEVSLSVRTQETRENNHRLLFSIKDSGIGIAENDFEKLFKSFSQVDSSTSKKYGGTGLGLAISKKLIELMGGVITFKSTKGYGSTFEFFIPVRTSPGQIELKKHDSDVNNNTNNSMSSDLKILVAEDNPINQKLISHILFKNGFDYELVSNGIQAMQALKSNDYSLILMDCNMPLKDGFETSRQIRMTETRYHPIIAITADSSREDISKCMSSGMDDFISKPFEPDEFINKITHWLKKTEPGSDK